MKVLLGLGGADDSLRALSETIDRARSADDELTVAIVENADADRSSEEVERRVRDALDDAGFEAEIRRIAGHPGSQLVNLAESEGFDEIVLGGGRTSPMGKITVGSIAEFVVLNARVSVKLVR